MFKVINLLTLVFLIVVSCVRGPKEDVERLKYFDNKAQLTREEFQDGLLRDKKKEKEKKDFELSQDQPAIPPISKLLVSPPPPPMGSGELISFSVTEDVPLKDALIELGRVADVNIEVDPAIEGGIILRVRDKPLKTVVERICVLGELRYSYQEGIIRFEKDTPYTKNYVVDFLVAGDLWNSMKASMDEILSNNGSNGSININKPAGVISVFANSRVHQSIKEYLDEARRNSSAQVLIEAKIVEISLTDEYNAGIDWSSSEFGLEKSSSNETFPNGNFVNMTNSATDGGIEVGLIDEIFGVTLSAKIEALQKFGTTRTLSSPRIASINNQKAILKFTNSIIYFEIDIEEEEETDDEGNVTSTTRTYTSTQKEAEEGVTLEITPSIDLSKNEITLSVKPTLEVQIGVVEDPALRLQLLEFDATELSEVKNEVPLIQTRTLDTSLKMKSGDIMVIGGLMTEKVTNDESGVPFLSTIPILGHLFKYTTEDTEIVETVIFLKTTIINSTENGLEKEDKEFYDTFSSEKRRMF